MPSNPFCLADRVCPLPMICRPESPLTAEDSLAGWEDYIRPIKEKRGGQSEMILRTLHSTAAQVTPDSQGRVLIPNKLIEFAGLEKTIVVIGCYDYAEIWSESRYDSMVEAMPEDALRDALEELGL